MDPTCWASPDAPVDACDARVSRAAAIRSAVSADDEDEAVGGDPEYADLLDADWLERVADARERDDDLVDVGLTLDLDDRDDMDELAQVMDLDVGVLLTSLPIPVSHEGGVPAEARSGLVELERELGEGSLSMGALRDVLLPEERAARERAEDDEEVGEDEHFPVFESSPVLGPTAPDAEDDGGEADAQ